MNFAKLSLQAFFLTAVAFAASAADPAPKVLTLTSPDFTDGGKLPVEFTCDGARNSPSLKWENAPAGTKSFAVVMHHTPGADDTHVYLLLYNIPADKTTLAKNAKDLGTFGVNTVNEKPEYTPPCSKGPGDKTYTLTLYALSDAELKFDKPVTRDMLLAAIKDKTLASSAITVTYARTGKPAEKNVADHPPENAERRPGPGGPPELQRALQTLTLTPAQQEKVDAALQKFREKQEEARTELVKQLKETLNAQQIEKIEAAFKRPPAPPTPKP